MEIFPEINILSDFEAGMKCLQNPSLFSRLFKFGVEKVPQVNSFWTWGALIFAIFAAFSSLTKRIKHVFIHFRFVKPSSREVVEFSDDEDDDVSSASSDDEHDGETSNGGQRRGDEDFRIRGSRLSFKSPWQNGNLNWSEIASGKNVVRLWDSLGLRLDFDEDLFDYDSQSVVSTWDSQQDQEFNEFSGGFWNVPEAATMVLTAEGNATGDGMILGGYDSRMRRRVPALYAEWGSPAEKVAVGGVSAGGIGKVYVRDDVGGVLTVGDVRNVRRPLETVRDSDGDIWWDADAVIAEDEGELSG